MEHPHPRLDIKVPHIVNAILQSCVPLKKKKEYTPKEYTLPFHSVPKKDMSRSLKGYIKWEHE